MIKYKQLANVWYLVGAFQAARKFPPPSWTPVDDTTSIWERARKDSMHIAIQYQNFISKG